MTDTSVTEDLRPRSSHAILQWGRILLFAGAVIALHVACWPMVPPDMKEFLLPWYDHIVERGPVAAFAEPFSNYTPTYLYLLAAGSLTDPLLPPVTLIKLISIAGSGVLALSLATLLQALGQKRSQAALVLLMPSAAVNAVFLGQCDAYWAAACIFGLVAMLRGAALPALIWCGAAFAFKAQAAFMAPVVIGWLIGRRVPFWYWTVPALVYCALMLPAFLVGWPAADLATVYLRQAEWFDVAGNAANPWYWAWVFVPDQGRPFFPLGYLAAIAASAAIAALAAASADKKRALLSLALLTAILIPWLLPKMHERYFFLADALALALALADRRAETRGIAIAVQAASLLALFAYVTDWRVPGLAGALVAGAAILSIYRNARAAGAMWPRTSSLFGQARQPA